MIYLCVAQATPSMPKKTPRNTTRLTSQSGIEPLPLLAAGMEPLPSPHGHEQGRMCPVRHLLGEPIAQAAVNPSADTDRRKRSARWGFGAGEFDALLQAGHQVEGEIAETAGTAMAVGDQRRRAVD